MCGIFQKFGREHAASAGILSMTARIRPPLLIAGLLYQRAGVTASLWGEVVLAAAAGIGAMFLPPVISTEVSWAGGKGDD